MSGKVRARERAAAELLLVMMAEGNGFCRETMGFWGALGSLWGIAPQARDRAVEAIRERIAGRAAERFEAWLAAHGEAVLA